MHRNAPPLGEWCTLILILIFRTFYGQIPARLCMHNIFWPAFAAVPNEWFQALSSLVQEVLIYVTVSKTFVDRSGWAGLVRGARRGWGWLPSSNAQIIAVSSWYMTIYYTPQQHAVCCMLHATCHMLLLYFKRCRAFAVARISHTMATMCMPLRPKRHIKARQGVTLSSCSPTIPRSSSLCLSLSVVFSCSPTVSMSAINLANLHCPAAVAVAAFEMPVQLGHKWLKCWIPNTMREKSIWAGGAFTRAWGAGIGKCQACAWPRNALHSSPSPLPLPLSLPPLLPLLLLLLLLLHLPFPAPPVCAVCHECPYKLSAMLNVAYAALCVGCSPLAARPSLAAPQKFMALPHNEYCKRSTAPATTPGTNQHTF